MAEWGSTHRASLEAGGVTVVQWTPDCVEVSRGSVSIKLSGTVSDAELDGLLAMFATEPAQPIRWAREVKASRNG